jgi:hypothetical protein
MWSASVSDEIKAVEIRAELRQVKSMVDGDNIYKVSCMCYMCGAYFMEYKYRVQRGGGKYCSIKCKGEHQSLKQKNGTNKKCMFCENEYYVIRSMQNISKYCYLDCKNSSTIKQKIFTCKKCEKDFSLRISEIKKGRGTYCSRKCQIASYIGKDAPNWRGGINAKHKYRSKKESLPATLTNEQWKETLKYYNYRCAYCGIHEIELEKSLAQEHIIPVSRNGGFTKDNIVPSCGSCNSKKHDKTPKEADMRIFRYAE